MQLTNCRPPRALRHGEPVHQDGSRAQAPRLRVEHARPRDEGRADPQVMGYREQQCDPVPGRSASPTGASSTRIATTSRSTSASSATRTATGPARRSRSSSSVTRSHPHGLARRRLGAEGRRRRRAGQERRVGAAAAADRRRRVSAKWLLAPLVLPRRAACSRSSGGASATRSSSGAPRSGTPGCSVTTRARTRRRRGRRRGCSAARCVSSSRRTLALRATRARLVRGHVPVRVVLRLEQRCLAEEHVGVAREAQRAPASGRCRPNRRAPTTRARPGSRTRARRSAATARGVIVWPAAVNGLAVRVLVHVERPAGIVRAARTSRFAPGPPAARAARARAADRRPEHVAPEPRHEVAAVVEVEVRDDDRVDRAATARSRGGARARPARNREAGGGPRSSTRYPEWAPPAFGHAGEQPTTVSFTFLY